MATKIFVTNREGFVLWVPAHKPTLAEEQSQSTVGYVPEPTPVELKASLFLFEGELSVPFLTGGTSANDDGAKRRSQQDVIEAVQAFRKAAQEDPLFIAKRKYMANYNPWRVAAAFSRPSAPPPLPPPGVAPMPQGLSSMPSPLPPMPPALPIPLPSMPPGIPNPPRQSFMIMDQGVVELSHANMHSRPPPPRPAAPSAPAVTQEVGYPGRDRFPAPVAADPRSVNSRVQEPDPIEYPIPVPAKEKLHYMNPKTRVYIAALPRSRQTVWLRGFDPRPQHYNQLINCRGGVVFFARPTMQDIADSKPVVLFDRPCCTHFSCYNYCARPACGATHRSEEQIKTLIACRHRQLKDQSTDDRKRDLEALLKGEEDGGKKPDGEARSRSSSSSGSSRRSSHSRRKRSRQSSKERAPSEGKNGVTVEAHELI